MTANSLDAVVRGILQSVTEMVLYGVILFRTDPRLSLAVLALGCTHFGITRLLGKRARLATGLEFDKRGEMSRRLLESLQGIRVIKSFAAERFEHRRILDVADALRRRTIRLKSILFFETPIRHIADSLLICLALALSFQAMSQGRLRTGGFVLFVGLSMRALEPISRLAQQILHVHGMVGGASRVTEMLAAADEMPEGDCDAAPLRDAIELRGVSFAYRPGRDVLRDVNLTIRCGETVALVGPSGAGKTTLADLIVRLYDPTEGAVLYDGADVRAFRQRSYRRHFGVVPQDPLLFHAPLREVVAFNSEPDDARLEASLRAAMAWDFVRELPDGPDTIVGERGAQLSGGQRQRIAIARAIYGRPSILVLDEATSSLDSESERALQEAIAGIVRGMTAIIIAHRFSTILNADKVVVLNRGRIEAVGTHETLLRACATYRYLYELQFSDPCAPQEEEGGGVGESLA
jgi:subfamily B ATP-binding cassette protein MsbA